MNVTWRFLSSDMRAILIFFLPIITAVRVHFQLSEIISDIEMSMSVTCQLCQMSGLMSSDEAHVRACSSIVHWHNLLTAWKLPVKCLDKPPVPDLARQPSQARDRPLAAWAQLRLSQNFRQNCCWSLLDVFWSKTSVPASQAMSPTYQYVDIWDGEVSLMKMNV